MVRQSPTQADEAFDRVVDFPESFLVLGHPRQRGTVFYLLDEVLLLVLLGVLAGCESWGEIERSDEQKLDLLRRFRPFKDGTLSHDQLGDIFAVLDDDHVLTLIGNQGTLRNDVDLLFDEQMAEN